MARGPCVKSGYSDDAIGVTLELRCGGTTSDMTEPSNVLRFDRAEFADRAAGGTPCASCKGPLETEYWRWQKFVFCAKCRPKIDTQLASSQSNKAVAKAALHGAGVALACGLGYAGFVAVTKFQLALLTIGIA